jgi:hypothetical protein
MRRHARRSEEREIKEEEQRFSLIKMEQIG